MGIRIEKKNIVYENVGCISIEPCCVFPNIDEVKEYLKDNPFPETEHYTAENLLGDTQSSDAWWLPDEVTEEQKTYIEEMTEFFL